MGEVEVIDFDFWIDGQDGQPKGVQIHTVPVESHLDRQVVIAKFTSLGEAEILRFYFERVRGVWRLDEVISAGSSSLKSWTLSTILKYGWPE